MEQRGVVSGLAIAALATGCVHVRAQSPQPLAVSAHIQVAAQGPRLESVPDVPEVPGQRVNAAMIHAALDQHGRWIDHATYGVVWIPSLDETGAEFVPYGTQGRWVLTDAGWYWQSQFAWGWLTFHYGRWVLLEESWAWVPGGLFAPAWVDWRVGNGWIGWAPLPPRGAAYTAPYAFCAYADLTAVDVWTRVRYGAAGASLYAATTSVAPTYGVGGGVYSWGPSRETVGTGPVVVPVAHAWREETSPRSGTPARASGSVTASARPVGARGSNVLPLASASRLDLPAPRPPLDPTAPRPAPAISDASLAAYPRIPSGSRYRTPDTLVIPSSASAPRLRETISLGTTDPVLPPSSVGMPAVPSPVAAAPAAPAPIRVPYIPPRVAPIASPPPIASMPPAYGAPSHPIAPPADGWSAPPPAVPAPPVAHVSAPVSHAPVPHAIPPYQHPAAVPVAVPPAAPVFRPPTPSVPVPVPPAPVRSALPMAVPIVR
jgi:hypothetical protein